MILKRVFFILGLLVMSVAFTLFLGNHPSEATVKCCNWDYPGYPDLYEHWHPQGSGWFQDYACYACNPDHNRINNYWFQRGYWDINVAQISSCNDCPLLKTCDQAYYQNCASGYLHNGVQRITFVDDYGNGKCVNYADRWSPWWNGCVCNSL
jgi:hypothetical protein